MSGAGTPDSPWALTTPSGKSEYQAGRDESADPPALVCQVGSTRLSYQRRCAEDLQAMLKTAGDWVLPGAADEQKPATEGTVEAWGRAPDHPVGGWYGLKKGLRGRLAVYVPPVLEQLGLADFQSPISQNRRRLTSNRLSAKCSMAAAILGAACCMG